MVILFTSNTVMAEVLNFHTLMPELGHFSFFCVVFLDHFDFVSAVFVFVMACIWAKNDFYFFLF